MELDITKIKQVPLDKSQYYQEVYKKVQATLHHTSGAPSAVSVVNGWNKDERGRIATPFVISGIGKNTIDGQIIQAFSSKHFAYHLGVKEEVFKARKLPWKNLDKISIGIEICNWGGLEKIGEKFYNYVDGEVPADQVCELDMPYKNYKYCHKYTDAQIESVRQLLLYLGETYNIDLTYSYDQMFTVNDKALKGENGLYTHNSYRRDKTDVFPQKKLIEMLQTLTS